MNFSKKLLAYILMLLVLPATLLANWERPTEIIEIESTNKEANQQVDVAYGLSTEKDKILYNQCINSGEPNYLIRPESFAYLDKRWTLAELKQYFELDISSSVSFSLFQKRDVNKFVLESLEKTYAESFTYFNKIDFGKKVHTPLTIDDGNGHRSFFNELGQSLLDLPDVFKESCGDKYIQTMNTGADLFLQATLFFYNKQDKAYFESKHDFALLPFAKISAKVKAELESFVDLGEIKIMAVQRGGVPAELNKILTREATQCGFDNMEACEKTIGQLIDYAKDEWPKQLHDPTDDHRSVLREYKTQSYKLFNRGRDPSAEPHVPLDVLAARMALGLKYLEIMDDRNTVAYNLTVVTERNGYDYRKRLLAIQALLNVNMELVRKAGELCFEELDQCAANAEFVLNTLGKFHRDDLELDKNRDTVDKIISAKYGHIPNGNYCNVPRELLHVHCEGYVGGCDIGVNDGLCRIDSIYKELYANWTCKVNHGRNESFPFNTIAQIDCGFIPPQRPFNP